MKGLFKTKILFFCLLTTYSPSASLCITKESYMCPLNISLMVHSTLSSPPPVLFWFRTLSFLTQVLYYPPKDITVLSSAPSLPTLPAQQQEWSSSLRMCWSHALLKILQWFPIKPELHYTVYKSHCNMPANFTSLTLWHFLFFKGPPKLSSSWFSQIHQTCLPLGGLWLASPISCFQALLTFYVSLTNILPKLPVLTHQGLLPSHFQYSMYILSIWL